MADVTQILSQIEEGDPNAAEHLLPLVYEELRKLAAAKMAHEKPGQTLQATALVHDAYLRLVNVEKAQHWDSRGHFFAAAAEAMRRILIEQCPVVETATQGHARRPLTGMELEADMLPGFGCRRLRCLGISTRHCSSSCKTDDKMKWQQRLVKLRVFCRPLPFRRSSRNPRRKPPERGRSDFGGLRARPGFPSRIDPARSCRLASF